MDIKQFIEETLAQTDEGIKAAYKRTGKHYSISTGDTGVKGVFFSLAVTNAQSNESGKEKGAGLNIRVIDAGLSNTDKSKFSSESISRIEFDIVVS